MAQLPGAEQLGGAGVDDRGVECLGQSLFGRCADCPAFGAGLRPGGAHEFADESVPAQRELAESASVAGDVRLAQLVAELVDAGRVGADEEVGQPGGEWRFRSALTALLLALALSPASLACLATWLRAAVKSSGGNP